MNNEIKKINLTHSFIFFLFSNIFSIIIFKLNNFNISPLICLLLILTIGVSHGSLDHVKGKRLFNIVIGSGFGGIAAALRLKAKGHEVTLIEKHQDLGGRARVFRKNGFIFDGGPTVITAPYLINELFELFKKDPKDYIELSPLKIWYQFIFEDKSKFNYSGNENEMKAQIEELNKEDVQGYEKLVNFTKKIFDKGFTELADVPFDKPFVMMQQLPALLKLKSYKSVYSLVSTQRRWLEN